MYVQCEHRGHKRRAVGLGIHPDTGKDILIKKGPYGWYVEHAETRTSLAPLFTPETVQLDQALWLLSLPHELGKHPKTDLPIIIGLGRFGPYVKYQNRFYSIKQKYPDTLTLHQAVDLIDHAPAPKKPLADKPEVNTKTAGVTKTDAARTTEGVVKSTRVPKKTTKTVAKSEKPSAPRESNDAAAEPAQAKTPSRARKISTAVTSLGIDGDSGTISSRKKTPSKPEA